MPFFAIGVHMRFRFLVFALKKAFIFVIFYIHINSIKVKKSKQKLLVPTGKMRCFLNFEALVLFPKAEIKFF